MMPPTARLLNTLEPSRLPTSSSVSPCRAAWTLVTSSVPRCRGRPCEADEAAGELERACNLFGPVDDEVRRHDDERQADESTGSFPPNLDRFVADDADDVIVERRVTR